MSDIPKGEQVAAVAAGLMEDAAIVNNITTIDPFLNHTQQQQQQQQAGMSGLVVNGDEYVQHNNDDEEEDDNNKNNVLPQQQQQRRRRRSHTYFGCCCDTRRAVLVINFVSLCFFCLFLWISAEYLRSHPKDPDGVENPVRVENTISFAQAAMAILCIVITIYGADQYNKIAILIGGLGWVVELVWLYCTYRLWDVVIIAPMVLYPHAVLYYEMKLGILSRETYPHERRRCCEC